MQQLEFSWNKQEYLQKLQEEINQGQNRLLSTFASEPAQQPTLQGYLEGLHRALKLLETV